MEDLAKIPTKANDAGIDRSLGPKSPHKSPHRSPLGISRKSKNSENYEVMCKTFFDDQPNFQFSTFLVNFFFTIIYTFQIIHNTFTLKDRIIFVGVTGFQSQIFV